LEWLHKARKIREKVLGTEHDKIVRIYNDIGNIHLKEKEYHLALEWLYNASNIYIKKNIRDNFSAATYHNIGSAQLYLSKYSDALEKLYMAKEIREIKLGTKNPETALTYNAIGMVYYKQKNHPEAQKWFDKAIKIFEEKCEEHPATAEIYNNIANNYCEQNKYKEAQNMYQQALTIYINKGKELDIANTCQNIAFCHYYQKEYQIAHIWFIKALPIYEKVLGKEHPDTNELRSNIKKIDPYLS